MAIYQPTNITPDLISGIANGVVFIVLGQQVTISWNVNGNSPMVAYQIDFYKNDAASTPGNSTGKVVLDTPFSPVSADGTVNRFSCQVPNTYFGTAQSSETGHTGKFKITQWWGATDDQSVVQRSLSVFQINRPSGIEIVSGPDGFGGNYTFTGAWTAPNPDYAGTSLLWARWQAWTFLDGEFVTVQDTGKVWGATSFVWEPDQFAPGDYYVQLSGESSQGEELLSDIVEFTSMEGDTAEMEGAVTAVCDKSVGAVKVTVRSGDYIPGYITGVEADLSPEVIDALIEGLNNMAWADQQGAEHVAALEAALDAAAVEGISTDFEPYYNGDGWLELPQENAAVWNFPANLTEAPWSFVWHGNFANAPTGGGNLFTILQTDGTEVALQFDGSDLVFLPTGQKFVNTQFHPEDEYLFVLTMGSTEQTKGQFYATIWEIYEGQAQMDETLTLTGYTQAPISSVTLNGGTTTDWATAVYGNANAQVLLTAQDMDFHREYDNPSVAFPGAGGLAPVSYFGSQTDGTVYRRTNGGPLEFFANFGWTDSSPELVYYDYGATNGNCYVYQVINQYAADTQAVINQSDAVSPCFWEWDLIETATEQNRANGDYMALNVFRFALNVASGSDGNGAAPGVYPTFTQYPVVMPDTQNRHSGTLAGLIGWLKAPGEYEDTNDLRDALRKLSGTKNTLFLRSRRGDFWKVAVSGEIQTSVNDNSLKQEITASVPWVEIGPVDGSVAKFGEIQGEGEGA